MLRVLGIDLPLEEASHLYPGSIALDVHQRAAIDEADTLLLLFDEGFVLGESEVDLLVKNLGRLRVLRGIPVACGPEVKRSRLGFRRDAVEYSQRKTAVTLAL